ncbi:MAG: pyridoxine 5'-phosphate synthase [Saprospiraceae bacterium]|nr:pyridoxine 5'-phosphate synthase [Candidatus Defluviibacterium haderslevense]MBK7244552.1 pyridoxine 5'-phosphate synthase [Candidatus Defluviibacterium haderslevense]
MTRLSVNINKIALIRNSRGANLPDLLQVAKDCEVFGAQGITVHPRPDERHVKFADIPLLKKVVTTEFNIEGYPSAEFMRLVLDNRPDQCTLVPDPPGVLTSNTGWNTKLEARFLQNIVRQLKSEGIRVSLFLNPDQDMVGPAAETGTDRIELYTGSFAHDFYLDPVGAIQNHIETAVMADQYKLGVNAGHDLNLDNLKFYKNGISNLLEVSIGHAIICDALYYGLENIIPMYLKQLQ